MGDEDNDVDVESDFEDDDEDGMNSAELAAATQFMTQAEKRAHHNALERKRRDHIKASFSGLREAIPTLKNGKLGKSSTQASRAQILQQATEYIEYMKHKNKDAQSAISDMKIKNQSLEQQIKSIERTMGNSPSNCGPFVGSFPNDADRQSTSSSDSSGAESNHPKQRKKMKTATSK